MAPSLLLVSVTETQKGNQVHCSSQAVPASSSTILTDSHQPMPGVQWLRSQSLVWCERTFSRGPVEVGRSQEHHPRKGLSPLGSLLSSPLLPSPMLGASAGPSWVLCSTVHRGH